MSGVLAREVLKAGFRSYFFRNSIRLLRQKGRHLSRSSQESQYPILDFVRTMNKDRLVWVDLEMTGLDIETCHIIEMACLITDGNLKIVAEGPNLVINQSDEVLNAMNEWCIKHHGESGLTTAVKASDISLQKAEEIMVEFVKQHIPSGCCPLAGNSIHEDKKFLQKYMPRFMEQLHYRIVDVSTVKEICRRWFPKDFDAAPAKACQHRALDDIRESIKELQYYRSTIFKSSTNR